MSRDRYSEKNNEKRPPRLFKLPYLVEREKEKDRVGREREKEREKEKREIVSKRVKEIETSVLLVVKI